MEAKEEKPLNSNVEGDLSRKILKCLQNGCKKRSRDEGIDLALFNY